VGLLGLFLIAAGLWPRDWAWVFVVAGFVSFVFFTGKGIALWKLDGAVFEQRPPGRIDRCSILERSATRDARVTSERRASRALTWQLKSSVSPGRDGAR